MAMLKSSVVQGSLRVTDTTYATTAQLSILNAPTSSNGTSYGPGTTDYVLMSNGTSVYWGTGMTNALKALDVSTIGNANGTKYIAAISQADGKISATAVDVATTYSSTGTTAISGTGVAAAIGTLDVSSVGGDTSYISAISESDGKISATSKSIQSTYSSTGTLAINGTGVAAALATLDGNLNNTTPGAGKTLTALSQTDGKVSATFGNISITKSQVSDFDHTHPWSEITSQPTLTNVAISANVTTNANYPIVFATSNTSTTAAKNEGLQKSGAKLYFNPSTGNLQATTFNSYTLAAASAKDVVTAIDTSASLPTSNAVKTFVEGKGYVTSSGVTSVATGAGLTGGTITGTGTIKAYLKSETKATYNSTTVTNTSSRQYAVTPDKTGYLSVNVPWTDTHRVIKVNSTQALASNTTALNLIAGNNVSITDGGSGSVTIAATDTTYSSKAAASGGTAVSLVTTGEKYNWNSKADIRYTEDSTPPSNPTEGIIWLQKKPSSSANGGNMPNAMFQTVSITIPYNTATYIYSNSWITNETAIVATNLAQIGFRDTYITWTIQTGQIVFQLGSAISRNITFQVAMIK